LKKSRKQESIQTEQSKSEVTGNKFIQNNIDGDNRMDF